MHLWGRMGEAVNAVRKGTAARVGSCVIVLALVSACGGGGGGGTAAVGNSLPSDAGPGDTEALFPNATGDVWYYDVTHTSSPGATTTHHFETVAVTGQKSLLGVTATTFLVTASDASGAGIENYYYKNSGGLAALGNNESSDTMTAALSPHVELLFPVAAGTVAQFSKSNVDFGADIDGDSVNERVDLTLGVTVQGFEALDTQLGNYPRTARSRQSLRGTLTLSSTHDTAPFSSTQDIWAVPGVGVVKRSLSGTVGTQQLSETTEARGYVVDGVGHGLSAPLTVMSNLAIPNSDIYSAGKPSLACGPANCLVLSSGSTGVVGALYDPLGAQLSSLNLGTSGLVTTAFDGTNYIVVIASGGAPMRAHRVTPAGVSLDGTTGIPFAAPPGSSSGFAPAIAAGSGNSLVVYSVYDSQLIQHLLYGVFLDRSGQVTALGQFPIAVDNSTHVFPVAAFDGTNYLVVWQQHPQSGMAWSSGDVYGVRVSAAGAVVDPSPIAISVAPNFQGSPSIAFDGTNYLVIWLDGRNLPANNPNGCDAKCELYGTRVAPSGALLDGAAASGGIAIATDAGYLPSDLSSVGFDGSNFLVAWPTPGYGSSGTIGSKGIRLARVSGAGALLGTPVGGIAVSGGPPDDSLSQYALPVIASRGTGASIVWLDNTQRVPYPNQLLAVTSY